MDIGEFITGLLGTVVIGLVLVVAGTIGIALWLRRLGRCPSCGKNRAARFVRSIDTTVISRTKREDYECKHCGHRWSRNVSADWT